MKARCKANKTIRVAQRDRCYYDIEILRRRGLYKPRKTLVINPYSLSVCDTRADKMVDVDFAYHGSGERSAPKTPYII